MGHIFLSYSHRDKDYVHKLQKALQKEGFDVWIDDRIDYGTEWPKVIQKHLDECDAFVVVVSENAYESKWVQNELARAGRKKKPFFPLLLQGDPWLSVEATQYVDVTDGSLPNEKFYQMLAIAVPRKEPEKRNSISEEKTLAEKAARERAEREKVERELAWQKAMHENARLDAPRVNASQVPRRVESKNFRWLGLGGIVFIGLLLVLFSGNYFVQNLIATLNNSPTSQPTNTPLTNPVAGDPWMQIIDGMNLVFVPAGKFTMGSGENLDQQPIHQVDMDAFWIDQTEVTNKMYAKCVDAGKCDLPNFPLHYYDSSYANHPVVFVSWNDAFAYCFWAHRRLPTEAEWEKAARGTESFIYPWGNESPNSTLLNDNRNFGSTTEVGKYPDGISVYGALDMAGNVWEWVSSLHKPYPYDASDGRENMESLEDRVHRGGSWNSSGVSSTYRSSGSPTFSANVIGFRCARSQP